MLRTFGWSIAVTAVGLVVGYVYAGATGIAVVAILAALEVSLSFDNSVINSTVLVRMNPFWQRMFLTVGVAIAVFGMRMLFPLIIVGFAAKMTPGQAVRLALDKGDPNQPGTYGYLLHEAHPAIAAFGGVFLLMLFLDFLLHERELTWLSWIERPLARIGRLNQLPVVLALTLLVFCAYRLAPDGKTATVLVSGTVGLIAYLLVTSLAELFDARPGSAAGQAVRAAGKAAFSLFLYLEVLDASFSLDGVVGAFAITSDPIIIAIGLGIGAMFIRSLTVLFVRSGTLGKYEYLEHGALWAIGALALLLLVSMRHPAPELVTGLVGMVFIGAGTGLLGGPQPATGDRG